MRSESTSALGHPKLTNPTVGGFTVFNRLADLIKRGADSTPLGRSAPGRAVRGWRVGADFEGRTNAPGPGRMLNCGPRAVGTMHVHRTARFGPVFLQFGPGAIDRRAQIEHLS